MIAKRIDTKAKTPRLARLVKYVVAAQGGLDPRSWTRTADYVLNSGTSNRGEKVGGVRVTNCHTDDPAAATALIECTQAANTRSKTDKTYHLVFAFPHGEEPDLKVLHEIEDALVKAIGFEKHQRISAVHIDTDHLHVHVAINKVIKVGNNYNNITPFLDQNCLMETCELLEIKYDLERVNHGLDGREPKTKVKDQQATAEAHSGIESLTGFIQREVSPAIHKAKNWQQLHAALASHGLEIKKRGAGLVIGSGNLWVRASQCDRAFSLKHLTDRLGPYKESVRPAKQSVHPASRAYPPYQPKPIHTHVSSAALFEIYQSDRDKYAKIRAYGLEQAKYEGALLEASLKKWTVAQRLLVKMSPKGPKRRAMLKVITLGAATTRSANWRAMDKKRKEVLAQTAIPSWARWLAQQAEAGNLEAVAVLRSRQELEAMHGNVLAGKNPETVILKGLKLHAGIDGSLTYNTTDGGLVIDRKSHVQSYRTTSGSSLMALELAAKRFKGQALIVEGQDSFQKEVAQLAGMKNINVRFADPALERIRKQTNPPSKTLNNEVEI